MHVTVRLYGNLKRYSPQKMETTRVEVEPGATVRELLSHLAVPDGEVWMSAINDKSSKIR